IDKDRVQEDQLRIPGALQKNLSGIDAQWIFSNAKTYGFSIAPEDGRRISVEDFAEISSPNQDNRLRTINGSWDEFLPGFGRHHVLDVGVGGAASNQMTLDTLSDARFFLADLRARLQESLRRQAAPASSVNRPRISLAPYSMVPPIH